MPNSVWLGIILSHWGRLDAEPASNTAYPPDNYTQPWTDEWQPADWRRGYLHPAQHPCFDPRKVRRLALYLPVQRRLWRMARVFCSDQTCRMTG